MDDAVKAELAALRAQLDQTQKTLSEVARVVTAGYHENLFWLRKLHHGSATYMGDHTALTWLSNGCQAYVDTRSTDVGIHLLQTGTWEPGYTAAFRKLLTPGARVADIGANFGWYSLVAAPLVGPAGRVFAVEPNPRLARLVADSLRVNGFRGFAKVFQVALGDAPGVVDLFVQPDMPGSGYIRPATSMVPEQAGAAQRVACERLDDLLLPHVPGLDVLKMDVEGWEGMVFRGMPKLLAASPGLRMILEWSPQQDASPAPRSETAAQLGTLGYTPFRVGPQGELERAGWEALVKDRELINLVLLPEGDSLAA
jgi:FkbM family methyltransferase